jgi:signal transduction histidine kinase
MNMECQTINFGAVAAQLANEARERFPSVQIVSEGVSTAVASADAERVVQLGRILLTNACESAQRTISWITEADAALARVRWRIIDDGPGVTPETVGRLFEPFFSTRSGHAGLGLALAQKIVSGHGGTIQAGNRAQGGFEVQVSMPSQSPLGARKAELGVK